MDFHINIKEKSFFNKHNNTSLKVLENIDVNIKSKEFVCILGPSGCGKTTLMNIIGGLVKIDNNQVVMKQKTEQEIKFGYVFQTSRLLPWLTVKENVQLVCKDQEESEQNVIEILSNFGLKDFINYYPKAISGGMRRKVSLARAFINNPQVLLMDEPFVSLDQPTSENLYELLVNYWKKKPLTIIFITHNPKEAILLGDRILFFSSRPGTVVFDYKIKSKRNPLKIDNKEVEDEYNQLTKKYPKILNGLL